MIINYNKSTWTPCTDLVPEFIFESIEDEFATKCAIDPKDNCHALFFLPCGTLANMMINTDNGSIYVYFDGNRGIEELTEAISQIGDKDNDLAVDIEEPSENYRIYTIYHTTPN